MESYTKEEKKHCNEIIEFIRHSLKEEKFKALLKYKNKT